MGNKKSFFNRQAKAGTYTAVVSIVVLAVLVVVNLIVGALPQKYTVLDTSANDLYTLTETTETSVKQLAEPITIYYITNASVEDQQLTTFLERFTSLNSLISLKKIDPTVQPAFLEQYTSEQVSENSLVVESERRFKVVDNTEIYVLNVDDYYSFMMSNGASGFTLTFAGEQAVVGALDFVTTDKLPTLYTLTGHGEAAIAETFSNQLVKSNIAIESLSLLTMSALPENADCVMINTPTADLNAHEAEVLTAYLEQGGHLFLLTDYRYDPAKMPNLTSVAAHYGITGHAGVVMEGDSNRYYQVPYYIVPTVESHEITDAAKGLYAFITSAHGLTVEENVRSSLTVSPLFSTSEKSFLAETKGDQVSTTKPEGAEERSFALGVAASEEVDGGTAKMVWISGAQMMSDMTNQMVSGGNYALLGEMVNWMCEREQSITVPGVTIEEPMLVISEMASNLIAVVIIAIIPIGIAAFGCVYWLKRRRR